MTARKVPVFDKTPVTYMEPLIYHGSGTVFAEGHPLRGQRCLLCAETIGGRPVLFVTIAFASEAGCACGSLVTYTRLVCASHHPVDGQAVYDLAGIALRASHPEREHKWPG